MKKRLGLLLALALTGALPIHARGEDDGDGCACERRCELRRDRPPRFQERGDVERLRRLRELRRRREGLERALRRFDRNRDGRLDELERRRIRAIHELRDRRRERPWEMRERRWERRRGLREEGQEQDGRFF
jgi:hypothetical protein